MEFEVKHEQIEVISPPLETFDDLFRTILAGRLEADAAARAVGARAVALATAPSACEPHLVDAPRYELMQERFGHTLREQLTCGFHVHVSVGSDEEGVAVLDRIRPWLPVLLAFSANSPFWQGVDTGFASFRYQAWSRWPTAGAYDIIGSAEAYAEHCRTLVDTEVPVDTGMIYFDARLSSHVPTVETRIADVCLRPVDAAVLAVITRALVETAAAEWEAGIPPDPVPTSLLRLASWRASKSGVRDTLVHPVTRTPVPAEVALEALLGHIGDHFADRDEELMVHAAIASALRDGGGATTQRRAMASRGGYAGVVADALQHNFKDHHQRTF
jgi:carboxylate-amine ligase